ncbi:MAG: transglutaminase-like domain-containing protein, partial [Bacteroidota bacterium]
IYNAVRDGWRYSPYDINFTVEGSRASYLLTREHGHCIDKATLMIAMARACGIPARLCLAKVRNHLATEKLEAYLESNEMVPHGIAELYLEGQWVKATPTFNSSLCEYLSVDPLEFNGRDDSLFQQYDRSGQKYMEYLEDYGHFEEIPLQFIRTKLVEHYPQFFGHSSEMRQSSLPK